MVRRDPMNERGPVPAGGRPKKPTKIVGARTLFQLAPIHEYERLWDCALEGAQSQMELLEGYTRLGVPRVPLDALKDLAHRLDVVIKSHEETI